MKFQCGLIIAGAAQSLAASFPRTSYGGYRPLVKSQLLRDGITTEGLMGNLRQLDTIAKANSNNRAFGLPGYAASVDYILSRTAKSSNFVTWVQDFPALFQQVQSITFSVSNTSYHVIGFTYSPSTTKEGVTAPLVLGATGAAGCTNEGYANLDVKGKIVLLQRGLCPDETTFAGRVRPATAAGAAAIIIYATDELPVTGGTLNSADRDKYVASGYINKADGEALVARLQAGETIEAYFQQTQIVETRITQNVFTETKDGDPTNVIVLGAHLDSVQAGPGINDDGSGTSLLLEIKTALEKFRVTNKVRFAWWGAEENGLLGSKYYTQNLNATAANNILAYLNFDMVSRGTFNVFDGDGSSYNVSGAPGSDKIEKLFVDYLTGKGINVTAAVFTGGSDYKSFMQIGKPVGGMNTGTAPSQDPCYHQACDTIDNPNPETITVISKAAAHVLSILATKGTEIIPKSPVNATMITSRGLIGKEIEFFIPEGERHLDCGGDV